jgi:hypothetical protein
MPRVRWFVAFLSLGCGDLEADRVCASPPCRVPGRQSPECAAFAKCYYATGGFPGSIDSTYGPGGTCWTSGETSANACTQSCASSLPTYRALDAGC